MGFDQVSGRIRAFLNKHLLGGTLRARVIQSGAWVGGGSVAEQASRFARNMILTRLLAPSSFGVMAIVMAAASIVSAITDAGIGSAVIASPKGEDRAYLNAGWWMGFGRSTFIYLVIFLSAPLVAHFYGNAELSGLLRVTLLGELFDGTMSPLYILAQKKMNFGRVAAISNGGGILGVVTTVVLSFFLRDVWALAIGAASENLYRFVLSYIVCPSVPSFKIDRHAVRDLYKFSRGVFGLSFLNLIFIRTDVFVLGKLYSATQLGLYTMAVILVQTPSIFLIRTVAGPLFPAFSHVQDDKERVNRILIEVTSWLILLGLPGVVAIYWCAPSLLRVIYGARYIASAGPLAVAAVVIFFNVLNAMITCVFNGLGRPSLHRRAVMACAIVMLIAIYPCCRYFGVVGGQISALLAILVSYFLQVERMRILTGLNVLRYGRAFVPAILVSLGVLGVGLGARTLGWATHPVANLTLGAVACLIAYALCVPAFRRIKETA